MAFYTNNSVNNLRHRLVITVPWKTSLNIEFTVFTNMHRSVNGGFCCLHGAWYVPALRQQRGDES